MIVRVQKREHPFVIIDKRCLEDQRLSWKAKGILAYLLSRPDNWRVYISQLVSCSSDGETAVASAMKELKDFGYAKLETVRDDTSGKVDGKSWIIFENTDKAVFPVSEKPSLGKPGSNNKELNKTEENTGKAKAFPVGETPALPDLDLDDASTDSLTPEALAALERQYDAAIREEPQAKKKQPGGITEQWAQALPVMYAILAREFPAWSFRKSPARNTNMKRFWRANGRNADSLKALCAKVKASDYLMGANGFEKLSNRPRIDASWIFQPEKAEKIMADDYGNERMAFALDNAATEAKGKMVEVLHVGQGKKKIPENEIGTGKAWLSLGIDAASGLQKVVQKNSK